MEFKMIFYHWIKQSNSPSPGTLLESRPRRGWPRGGGCESKPRWCKRGFAWSRWWPKAGRRNARTCAAKSPTATNREMQSCSFFLIIILVTRFNYTLPHGDVRVPARSAIEPSKPVAFAIQSQIIGNPKNWQRQTHSLSFSELTLQTSS